MTGRERLTIAARGGEPDATPIVTFGKGGDAAIVAPNVVSETVDGQTAVLARVLSPLGRRAYELAQAARVQWARRRGGVGTGGNAAAYGAAD